ncbi:hypothetical protein Tsubulata_031012 [Turnera subulata]|uniref:Pre-rRNA-processing protein RIX1 N-terminal domain-containing protein n=1 Tax=Turnera subulata TaxID=218843 RepID=A0A9Q0FJC5_9ROSI|nr:hypothetical protein Tsubulata_031012 [Turnera subulata]
MAGLTDAKNMYDVALRPAMLRTILQEDLPDEKKPFSSPSSLSRIVSLLQTHRLLSEPLPDSGGKLTQRWKSAVDDWIARLLSLLSTTTPDKCWAGICLLGVTCQECSPELFLSSYTVWFEKLLVHIQSSPADSQFVKVAACNSISDLITRLGGFPNVKKEGTSLSGKIVQPVLKLLNEDSSDALCEGAVHLLCAVINFFPGSLHRHYDTVETTVVSKILCGRCSINVSKKLAHCLALLPKARDEDSWLSSMRKILLLVNGFLTEIFQGLEEDAKWDEAVRLLVPPGEVPPLTLWDQQLLEQGSDKEKKRSKLSSISVLMFSCCLMLNNPYPVQVTVPIRSLLALVERVLMVDGSLSYTRSHFVISAEQEFICSELPVLHSYSLDLLSSVIKGIRSQLLPHAARTVRLVKEYFKSCELPDLRIKIYSIAKMLLMSMGVGIAIYLAQEVVNNSLLDLNPTDDGISSAQNSKASSDALLQHSSRKRKQGTTGSLEQQHDRILLETASHNHPTTPASLKIAALEALEALLTVGGALKSESWRSKVDHIIITMAIDSCKGGSINEERFLCNGHASVYADLHLAALRALLASVLSPSRVRPPHLARALELFNRGRQETGTKVSEFCAHALLALEVLIHPRGLPLVDFSAASSYDEVSHRFSEAIFSGGKKLSIPFSSGMQELGHSPPDSDDDLYENWLDSSKETKAPGDSLGKTIESEAPSEILRVQQGEQIPEGGSSGGKSDGTNDKELTAATVDVEMRQCGDTIMGEVHRFQESTSIQLHESSEGITVPKSVEDPKVTEKLTGIVSGADGLEIANVVMADKSLESDMESIPDIVDAEPDSD